MLKVSAQLLHGVKLGDARLAKKPVPGRQELIARPFEDKAGPGGFLPGEIPSILNMICADCKPMARCPGDSEETDGG